MSAAGSSGLWYRVATPNSLSDDLTEKGVLCMYMFHVYATWRCVRRRFAIMYNVVMIHLFISAATTRKTTDDKS